MPATRHYTLELADRDDVLMRVVSLCMRRRAEVVGLRFVRGDRHRPARLELAVREAGPPLAERLRALVDVRAVEEA